MPDHLIPDLYDDDWAGGSLDSTPSVMQESDPSDPNDRTPFGPPSPFDDHDQGTISGDDDPRGGDERPPLDPFGGFKSDASSDGDTDKGSGGDRGTDYGKIIEAGIKGAVDAGRTAAEIAQRDREADRKAELEREKIQLQRDALDKKELQLEKDRAEREKRLAAQQQAEKERADDKNWRDRTPDKRSPPTGDTPPIRGSAPDKYHNDLNDRVREALSHAK